MYTLLVIAVINLVRSYLFILSIYLAQLLSVEVLYTLLCDIFTTTVIVEVKQRQ